jgi:hypothetical protein
VSIYGQDGQNIISFNSPDALPLDSARTVYQLNSYNGLTAYSITVDPLSFTPGVYSVVFTGDLDNGSQMVIRGLLGISELSRMERILTTAYSILMDNPEEYLFKPQVHQFKAISLHKFLLSGLQFFNSQPPVLTAFTIDTLPEDYDVYIVNYIVAQACFAKSRIGIENDFSINDSHSLQIETHAKYKSLFDTLMNTLIAAIKSTKTMVRPSPRGFARQRYPRLMMRLISLNPYYTSIFTNY